MQIESRHRVVSRLGRGGGCEIDVDQRLGREWRLRQLIKKGHADGDIGMMGNRLPWADQSIRVSQSPSIPGIRGMLEVKVPLPDLLLRRLGQIERLNLKAAGRLEHLAKLIVRHSVDC